jgi:hypothetical protein
MQDLQDLRWVCWQLSCPVLLLLLLLMLQGVCMRAVLGLLLGVCRAVGVSMLLPAGIVLGCTEKGTKHVQETHRNTSGWTQPEPHTAVDRSAAHNTTSAAWVQVRGDCGHADALIDPVSDLLTKELPVGITAGLQHLHVRFERPALLLQPMNAQQLHCGPTRTSDLLQIPKQAGRGPEQLLELDLAGISSLVAVLGSSSR